MIVVKVKDLLYMAKELKKDNIEYVAIEECEAYDDDPKSLHFEAFDGYGGGIDFESIYHVDISPEYKFQ